MKTYASNPSWFCGINDYRFRFMSGPFKVELVNSSYRDFNPPERNLSVDREWDDYCGMYMMGGEL